MVLDVEELAAISSGTRANYQVNAEAFRDGTMDHDVSQNIQALLAAIAMPPPLAILDFGCGPGRDLAAFLALGHQPIGLDGTQAFVEMARAHSGCEVWHQDFLALDLPDRRFDGIFANASLFHVPSQELPRVLGQLRESLKPGGVLFCSNPRGCASEGWKGGRYGGAYELEDWAKLVSGAGFNLVDHYYRPKGLPRLLQRWLATVWRRG